MSKRNVLVSIRPEYASKILDGEKTVELRRRFPEGASTAGAMILIYSSSPVRAIVGYARIKAVIKLPLRELWRRHGKAAAISKSAFNTYFLGLQSGFAILLENVTVLHRQPPFEELQEQFGFVPPQSFRYIDGELNSLLADDRIQTTDRHKRGNWA